MQAVRCSPAHPLFVTVQPSASTHCVYHRTQPSISIQYLLMQTLAWANGATYVGEVQDGLRHGQGTMRFSNSEAVYEGQWQQGKRHGQGKLAYNAAGTVYYEGGGSVNLSSLIDCGQAPEGRAAACEGWRTAHPLCSEWYPIWDRCQQTCVLAFSGVG